MKICGCTSLADVEGAVEAGADAIGFIFADSPRRVMLADVRAILRSVPPLIAVVGVFVDPAPQLVAEVAALGCLPQFSGEESPEFCAAAGGSRYIKAVHVEQAGTAATHELEAAADRFPGADVLFDSRVGPQVGGTGIAFRWQAVEPIARRRRVIVGGGLLPENVGACVAGVRPFAVDVRSGVETAGAKDRSKMCAFVRAVRESDAQT